MFRPEFYDNPANRKELEDHTGEDGDAKDGDDERGDEAFFKE